MSKFDTLSLLATTPGDEPCAQVGDPNYRENAHSESKRLIAGIEKKFGPKPEGCSLRIKGNEHDMGTYYDVIIKFDEESEECVTWAFNVENNLPATWKELEA